MYIPPTPPIPEYDPCAGKVLTLDRIIAKIRAASLRVGFNLWQIFQPLDEHGTNFLSEAKFLSIFLGPMKSLIGLEPYEVSEIIQQFKISDGRIAYTRLCQQVHGKLSPPGETDEQRRNELLQSNTLEPEEDSIITNLLAKISVSVTPRRLVIKPFFQDFELVQKDSGMVSKNTFIRVLNFMGVPLSPDEVGLLIMKYRHDSDTIKYEAFIRELDEVTEYLKKNDYVDKYGALRDDYFGVAPNLPDMDLKPVPDGKDLGIQNLWKEDCDRARAVEISAAFSKIREQVYNEKLRVKDFFLFHDEDDTGRVPLDVMKSCIRWITVSETQFNDLYITGREVDMIVDMYRDPFYSDKSLWKVFQDDLERGIDPKELESWPRKSVDRRSAEPFQVLHRPPTPPENLTVITLEDVFQHVKECMETLSSSKRLLSVLAKRDVDKTSYVTIHQFKWAFLECGIFLATEEMNILLDKYLDETGVNWRFFAEELSAYRNSLTKRHQQTELEDRRKAVEEVKRQKVELMESNVIEILAKVKSTIICKRVWMNDYLKVFDKHKKMVITRSEFERGLDQCGIRLSQKEMDILIDVFCLPSDPTLIEYTRFCRTVDEDSLPPCLVKPPLKEVISKNKLNDATVMPTHQWANFKQRLKLAMAMDKLSKHVGLASTDLFKSLDKGNTGTVSRTVLQNALFALNCLHLVTNNELDTIIHCFGFRKGHFKELDYMSFLNALDIVTKTKAAAKNL